MSDAVTACMRVAIIVTSPVNLAARREHKAKTPRNSATTAKTRAMI